MIDVAFQTVVDGPGVHGEVIGIVTRPALRPAEPSEITFLIRVEGARTEVRDKSKRVLADGGVARQVADHGRPIEAIVRARPAPR